MILKTIERKLKAKISQNDTTNKFRNHVHEGPNFNIFLTIFVEE